MKNLTPTVLAVAYAMAAFAHPASASQSPAPKNYDRALMNAFELAPDVRATLEGGGPSAHMGFNYLKYAVALRAGGDALDDVVAPSVVLHDLAPRGFQGLDGLKRFRAQQNAALQQNRSVIAGMKFPASDVTEIELCTERTDRATGNPAGATCPTFQAQ